MTRVTAARLLMAMSAVCGLLAAYYSARAQSLRWLNVDPATTNQLLWYSDSIIYVVLALIMAVAALLPLKRTSILLIATAIVLWFGAMARPSQFGKPGPNLPMYAIMMFTTGMAMRRLSESEQVEMRQTSG